MKRRILFVEDDPLLRQMYLLMLEQERDRWDVAAASNGPQALQAMQRVSEQAISGAPHWLSGLWHHQQRAGHPFRNTVVLIPGPSCSE